MICPLCHRKIRFWQSKLGNCHEECLRFANIDLGLKEFKKRVKILREDKT